MKSQNKSCCTKITNRHLAGIKSYFNTNIKDYKAIFVNYFRIAHMFTGDGMLIPLSTKM